MAGIELYAERKQSHRRTWTIAAVVLTVVFMLGGQLGAYFPAVATGFVVPGGGDDGWPQMAYQLGASFGLTALLVLLWAWLFERRGPSATTIKGYCAGAVVPRSARILATRKSTTFSISAWPPAIRELMRYLPSTTISGVPVIL